MSTTSQYNYDNENKNIWAIGFAMFLLRELIPKNKYVRFEFLMKVVVVNVSEILKGTDCLIE